jgi:uncharacterized membrane protein
VRAFDWLRGLAVLVMIQTHALVLLRPELRAGRLYTTLQWIDGLVAPSFIFAAGFAMALVQVRTAAAAGAAQERGRRFRRTLRRIVEVLLVATLVNWMWFPIFREPRWILRMDILQCIGLALLIALPILSGLAPRPGLLRLASLLLAALAFGVSPLAEQVGPPFGQFLNSKSGAVFPLLPWSGYVYLGAAVGATAARDGIRATVGWLLGLAALGIAIWWFTPQVAALYPPHEFWVTDPANHARRWTQVCLFAVLLLGVERLWPGTGRGSAPSGARTMAAPPGQPPRPRGLPAPVRFIEVFGTSSLAGYFLHEMLLYYRIFGFSFERIWRDRCSWPQYWAVLSLLIACTFALTVLVDRVYRRVDKALSAPALRPAA